MKLWRIPEEQGADVPDSIYRTELIVMAESRDEAIELGRAYMAKTLAPYPTSKDWHLYDEAEELPEPVYDVPMYGYSW